MNMMRHPRPENSRSATASETGFASAVKRLFGGQGRSDEDNGFEQVGHFLALHDLSPTPQNYEIAYRYLVEKDVQLGRVIDTLIEAGGIDDDTFADLHAEDRGDVSAKQLAQMIHRAQAYVAHTAKIIDQSHSATKSFGENLETNIAAASEDVALPSGLATEIVDLTKAMIEKTRHFEIKLKRMDNEIGDLKLRLDDARKDAMHDPLTGLPNRRAFMEQLNDAIATRGSGRSVCVAYCDIDHFKFVNDSYGHEVGDRVIQFIGKRLQEASKETMYVARFGGEEFVVLFRNLPLARAVAHMEALRIDIGERRLVCRDNGEPLGKITFSAGVAALEGGLDGTALLKAADQALYRAKELGRDRVETLLSQSR